MRDSDFAPYHPDRAAFLAGVAAAVYHPDAGAAWFATRGYGLAIIDAPATDTRALVAADGDEGVVAFRGTQDLRNWLTDLDCAFLRAPDGRIHRGFHLAFESVKEAVFAEIKRLPGRRWWITGHSLGGALAMLCARAWSGEAEGIYTFGQPRVGDAAFRASYNTHLGERTFRIVHSDDLIPRIPWLLALYRHAGREVFYPAAYRSLPLLNRPLWSKLPCEALSLVRQLSHGRLALLADHHIDRYLALFPAEQPYSNHFPSVTR